MRGIWILVIMLLSEVGVAQNDTAQIKGLLRLDNRYCDSLTLKPYSGFVQSIGTQGWMVNGAKSGEWIEVNHESGDTIIYDYCDKYCVVSIIDRYGILRETQFAQRPVQSNPDYVFESGGDGVKVVFDSEGQISKVILQFKDEQQRLLFSNGQLVK